MDFGVDPSIIRTPWNPFVVRFFKLWEDFKVDIPFRQVSEWPTDFNNRIVASVLVDEACNHWVWSEVIDGADKLIPHHCWLTTGPKMSWPTALKLELKTLVLILPRKERIHWNTWKIKWQWLSPLDIWRHLMTGTYCIILQPSSEVKLVNLLWLFDGILREENILSIHSFISPRKALMKAENICPHSF